MGRPKNLRGFFEIIKDKATISKEIIISKLPNTTSSLNLAILRATSSEQSTPPHENQIISILSFGHSSRNTASSCIESLMNRLHHTHNSYVSTKCLIIIHNIIKRGSFILQDQLSIYPSNGGKNYLNLSNFRDNSDQETWELSSLVRWSDKHKRDADEEHEKEKVSALLNEELLKEIEVVVGLIEEISKASELLNLKQSKLVCQVMNLVCEDFYSAQKRIVIRLNEVKERMSNFSFGESVEFNCVMKRLKNCEEKVLLLFLNHEGIGFWDLVDELMKEKIGIGKDGGRSVMVMSRKGRSSESARYDQRDLKLDDFRFSSGRFDLNRVQSGSRFLNI
ncbi:putative clathrin assembly protein At4g40080 isoform X2 [Papaver somniferum]|uniref:putative clathrin assembly protein At4g40080 isoform X2 n=1 Tax=Papaver somniferum TaxID=3469 RepID=UPI000E6F7838|nr:putative clathrin assembly protein At4g40080 isoform X2 [Papaver somniferum]